MRIVYPEHEFFEHLEVEIVEISNGGFKVVTAVAISPGSEIQLQVAQTTFSGTVRHCTRKIAGYQVGVQLDPLGMVYSGQLNR